MELRNISEINNSLATFEVNDLRKAIQELKSNNVELVFGENQYFPAGETQRLKIRSGMS
ncbi:hypothetical protein M948_20290 [Virgibacillus sp. CM-4]|nr:hypothetical protein M948_20290 [Virgibacillus sp. CM-4]